VRKVPEERYSFPLFFAVDYHTRIRPMARLVGAGESPHPGLVAGEHLYAQTARTFRYLRARLERGKLQLPQASDASVAFGQQARQQPSRAPRNSAES
jgi:hypothetical protein